MASDGAVSTTLSEWLLVILIIASLFFEFLLHRVEHWIQHRHYHLVSVVRVLYRELMILGLVSFLFILYETIEKPNGTIILSFEFAHVFIFLLAIFYTFVVLSTMFTSLRLSAQWKKMEQMDLVHYLNLKDKYSQMRTIVLRRHDAAWRLFWWFPNIVQLLNYIHMHEVMAFHDIRFQFIYYRNLPEDFRFSSFLRKIKSITFIELVESHWSLYLIFLLIVLGDILRRNVISHSESAFDIVESVFIITSAVILAICAQVLAVKVRRVYWQLTKHPRTYYEGVEADAVAEELKKAAEVRLQTQREARRSRSSRDATSEIDAGNVADDESAYISMNAEHELLDPMQPQPLSSPLAQTATTSFSRGTSSDTANVSSTSFRALIAPAAPTYTDEVSRHAAVRHSIDISKHSFERMHTDLSNTAPRRNSLDRPLTSSGDAIEDTLARHSLDVPRGYVSPPGRITNKAPSSFNASMARAAVEAARMRSGALNDGVESGTRTPKSKVTSPKLSRRTSLDEDAIRTSMDSRGRRGGRMSIELAVVMPRDELAAHFEGESQSAAGVENGVGEGEDGVQVEGRGSVSVDRSANSRIRFQSRDAGTRHGTGVPSSHVTIDMTEEGMQSGLSRGFNEGVHASPVRSTGIRNPTILKNWEHQRRAQETQPDARYPKLVTKLIPRLGRVASPVEKLFWFGSHKFFLWCVEFVLFFSTVLLAAASAGLSLLPLSKEEIRPLNIVSLVFAVLNLFFVLFRIAGIMKRYIFILHNASLIPEIVAIEAIHNVRDKRLVRDDASSASGSETEREEDDAARERRRRLGRFFRSEAESGNVPGIEGGSRPSRTSWDVVARRRWRKKMALRRRNRKRLINISVDEDDVNDDSKQATENTSSTASPEVVSLK